MQGDRVEQDAVELLTAIAVNQQSAMRGGAFTPSASDAERAGLPYGPNRSRFDAAMWWLLDNELLERDEAAEDILVNVKGLPDYDYGLVFRITKYGRHLLRQAGHEG
jgi:hypothetical protein